MVYKIQENVGLSTNKSKYNHMKGTIKTLKEAGFGFISREGEAKDLFFHSTALSGVSFEELREGDEVTFEVQDGEKGPSAVNVARA